MAKQQNVSSPAIMYIISLLCTWKLSLTSTQRSFLHACRLNVLSFLESTLLTTYGVKKIGHEN